MMLNESGATGVSSPPPRLVPALSAAPEGSRECCGPGHTRDDTNWRKRETSPRTQGPLLPAPRRASPAEHSVHSARSVPAAQGLRPDPGPGRWPVPSPGRCFSLHFRDGAPDSYFPGAPAPSGAPSSPRRPSSRPSRDRVRAQTFERIKTKRSRSGAEHPSSPPAICRPAPAPAGGSCCCPQAVALTGPDWPGPPPSTSAQKRAKKGGRSLQALVERMQTSALSRSRAPTWPGWEGGAQFTSWDLDV
ncbi:translation initiation factor IF-2-like [Myotis myotis]|uniref:translation initiation factor IF-2-like n=1 Tax=Myotis myotis TaxID=51298 RepID=UPI00174CCA97|nr:translation initiation factor IF-2-like [Myotis myotis]